MAELFGKEAKKLVRALEYIYLAATYTAAYLAVRAQTMNISTYLDLFRERTYQANLLASKLAKDIRRDGRISHAVITTWQISFDQIRKTTPNSAEVLLLMAMFDRQAMSEPIVSDGRRELQF